VIEVFDKERDMTLETMLDKDMYGKYERNFLNSIRSKQTRINYLGCFTKYKEFVGENTIIITHDNGPKIIESQIIDFLAVRWKTSGKHVDSDNYFRLKLIHILQENIFHHIQVALTPNFSSEVGYGIVLNDIRRALAWTEMLAMKANDDQGEARNILDFQPDFALKNIQQVLD
jgi:hypothetical protein